MQCRHTVGADEVVDIAMLRCIPAEVGAVSNQAGLFRPGVATLMRNDLGEQREHVGVRLPTPAKAVDEAHNSALRSIGPGAGSRLRWSSSADTSIG
jgi:hypothetical protein